MILGLKQMNKKKKFNKIIIKINNNKIKIFKSNMIKKKILEIATIKIHWNKITTIVVIIIKKVIKFLRLIIIK